jgi:hypothetical protein
VYLTKGSNQKRTDRQFDDQLTNGGEEMTLDEALIHWEAENQTDQEKEDALKAIEQGFSDIAAGRTRPFEEFDREFRSKHGLPPRS